MRKNIHSKFMKVCSAALLLSFLSACGGSGGSDNDGDRSADDRTRIERLPESLLGLWDFTVGDNVVYVGFDENRFMYEANYLGDAHDNGDSCYVLSGAGYTLDGDRLKIRDGNGGSFNFIWRETDDGRLELEQQQQALRFSRPGNGIVSLAADIRPRCGLEGTQPAEVLEGVWEVLFDATTVDDRARYMAFSDEGLMYVFSRPASDENCYVAVSTAYGVRGDELLVQALGEPVSWQLDDDGVLQTTLTGQTERLVRSSEFSSLAEIQPRCS